MAAGLNPGAVALPRFLAGRRLVVLAAAALAIYAAWRRLKRKRRQEPKPHGSTGSDRFEAAQRHARGLALSTKDQLRLYGLYKQSRFGRCVDAQPPVLDMTARAKWEAWHEHGGLSPSEAQSAYVAAVAELCPGWETGAAAPAARRGAGASGMGTSVSTMATDETGEEWSTGDDVFYLASTGNTEGLMRALRASVSELNSQDGEGRSVLHWACDRNNSEMVAALLGFGAALDLELRDVDGLTALAYATSCDHGGVAELLVQGGADLHAADLDGGTAIEQASAALAERLRRAAP